MAGKKETPDQIRERVTKHCASTATAQGGYHAIVDGVTVPAAVVVRDGKEHIVPVSMLTPEEAKVLGLAGDDSPEADEAGEAKADKPVSRKR